MVPAGSGRARWAGRGLRRRGRSAADSWPHDPRPPWDRDPRDRAKSAGVRAGGTWPLVAAGRRHGQPRRSPGTAPRGPLLGGHRGHLLLLGNHHRSTVRGTVLRGQPAHRGADRRPRGGQCGAVGPRVRNGNVGRWEGCPGGTRLGCRVPGDQRSAVAAHRAAHVRDGGFGAVAHHQRHAVPSPNAPARLLLSCERPRGHRT